MEIICGWHIANSILEKSFEEENYITQFKLNYLVYLLCSEYLYLWYEGPVNERFQKTETGPILPSIYAKFCSCKNKTITNYAKDASGKARGLNGELFNDCLIRVWENYKNISDIEILSYIESGSGYARREIGDALTESDMLIDIISRKEEELENAKSYLKKLTPQKNQGNK